MRLLIVVLALLGAALPIGGALRIYRRARDEARARRNVTDERGHTTPTMRDFDEMIVDYYRLDDRFRAARVDLWLVGAGFVLGSAASILSALQTH